MLGVFRKSLPEMMEDYKKDMKEICDRNRLEELFCRTMEEFLISGMAVHRKGFGFRDGKSEIRTDIVSPSGFFFNSSARDVRGWDVDLVGEIHDVDFRQWSDAFVASRESYEYAARQFEGKQKSKRVVEVWRREPVPRYLVHDRRRGLLRKENAGNDNNSGKGKRWILENVWRYYFLDGEGRILKSGDSPYMHGGHPFVFRFYPFLDGEIRSFVGDIIDQQKYANRLITLYDWVVRASAKGVLMIPEGSVAPDQLRGVADQWSRFNGVIVYKSKPGVPEPHQVSGNNTNMGIGELLDIQLKMLEDVSGVTGSLQGNLSSNSVSGTLYSQQTENARTSLVDIMDSFGNFIRDCYEKDLALVRQITVPEIK